LICTDNSWVLLLRGMVRGLGLRGAIRGLGLRGTVRGLRSDVRRLGLVIRGLGSRILGCRWMIGGFGHKMWGGYGWLVVRGLLVLGILSRGLLVSLLGILLRGLLVSLLGILARGAWLGVLVFISSTKKSS